MFFSKNYDNCTVAVIQLTRELNIPVTTKTIVNELESHPNHPSLLSMSDTLNQLRIANGAFNNVRIEQLADIPVPFIAHTKNKGNDFVLVKHVDEKGIHLSDKVIQPEDFAATFNNVILAVDTSEDDAFNALSDSNKYLDFLSAMRMPVVIGGLLLIIVSVFVNSSLYNAVNWQTGLAALVTLLGLGTSVMLLIQSIDANNPLIQKLCQNDTNKNCNAILSSKAAKVFEGLSWSEVGFFYFAGSFLSLLFSNGAQPVLQILAMLNVLCLPYTFYSIYYQAKIAKQWCVLCCSVQALLWLEFILLRPQLLSPFVLPSTGALLNMFICFALPFIAWIWAKPFLQDAQKLSPLTNQLNKFKYDADLFNSALTARPRYVTPDKSWSIVLGNEIDPDMIITLVSNPYCGPCVGAHKVIDELLDTRNSIQVRIVFSFSSSTNESDDNMLVARHILGLSKASNNKILLKEAINEWYNQKHRDFESWSSKYPAAVDRNLTILLENQKDWRNIADIRATPTILVNGYKLPYPYQLADLKYI